MAFDLSRYTFDPSKDYLGVVMQQGRVHLDSDWNELLAELLRRIHAGTLDIIGLSGVPATTAGAFQIGLTTDASGNLTGLPIGVGRIYVDGILAENHGSGTPQWDPTLGDFVGTSTTDFTQQPYVLGAPLPSLANTVYLVYLDVWQRDVSYLEDQDLVDSALGVDTTGRWQTVWQVKLLEVSNFQNGFAISTPDASLWSGTSAIAAGPIWQTLIQGSPSLLSNGTTTAGYTGQENQLYRVEIHQGGPPASATTLPATYAPGTATFKWSRENASVATTVTAIAPVTNSLGNSASQLTVASLGRDQVLGFQPNDWVEITDDYLELNGTSASPTSASSLLPGELHQIDSVSANAGVFTITLDSQVSGNFPLTNGFTDPTRHTRIRRWDQQGTVYLSDGQTVWADLANAGNQGIPVPPPGTSLILENGVTTSFALASGGSGNFQTGDYWMFAARAADGTLSPPLNAAPPLGIDHHIARLAILNFSGSSTIVASAASVIDCRSVFPSRANPSFSVQGVSVGGVPLTSGGTITTQNLLGGITFVFDSPIDNSSSAPTPVCNVTVQLPSQNQPWVSPAPSPPTLPWTQPAVLLGTMNPPPTPSSAPSSSIIWMPNAQVETALANVLSPTAPVAACLVLKGDTVRAAGGGPSYVYLNGATIPDGRAYADFEMPFSISSPPLVSLSTSAINFANPQIVGTSATASITVSNSSNTPLTIVAANVIVTGANAADFTVANLPVTAPAATPAPTTAPAGTAPQPGTCTLNVIFNPTTISPLTATRFAQLTVSGLSIDPLPLQVQLTGAALAPWISASAASMFFGLTLIGASSTQVLTITNSGTAPLSILGVAFATPATNFSFVNSCSVVQPGGTCTITVQFAPQTAGVSQALLQITHNAYGSPLTIPLTGESFASIFRPPVILGPIVR